MIFRTSSKLVGGLALLFLLPGEGGSTERVEPKSVGAEAVEHTAPIERQSRSIAVASADSLSLHSRARGAQGNFERLRSAYAPVFEGAPVGSCDEVIGRMCLRYLSGLPDDWVPPPEHRRVLEGRQELIDLLALVGDSLPGDPWVLGQRIAYLGEAGEWESAHEIALTCQSERWWCLALRGLTLHHLGSIEEAEEAFSTSLREMPGPIASEWEEVIPLIDLGFEPLLRGLSPDSLRALRERLWVLADPLYLLPGNDLWRAHFARHTLAAIRAEGDIPYGFRWGDDLQEIFVRYGPEVAYQQIGPFRPGVLPIPIVGRFDPAARGFFPSASRFLAPEETPPGEWRTDDRSVRSRYTPRGASRIGGIDVQQARFRRGEELLLVLGWRVADGVPAWEDEVEASGRPSGGVGAAESESAEDAVTRGAASASPPNISSPSNTSSPPNLLSELFLLPAKENLGSALLTYPIEPRIEEGVPPHGVATVQAPLGPYLLSLEIVDSDRDRGWRARHGVVSHSPPPGVPSLSDILLLSPTPGPLRAEEVALNAPDSLELHLERVLPSLTLDGDSVEVAWEVYGVDQGDGTARFTLSVSSEERGGVRRALEFLRLVSPSPPIDLTWEEDLRRETGTISGAPLFRRLTLDLSDIPAGRTRIRIEMHLQGREEVASEVLVDRTQPGR